MKTFFKKIHTDTTSGFVLLFSIVVSSIIFFIGIGIYSIATKELAIAELTENSQRSIFISDAGFECASLWYGRIFSEPSPNVISECLGNKNISIERIGSTSASFWLFFKQNDLSGDYRYDTCVQVTMEKKDDLVTVYSQGFNACEKGSDGGDPTPIFEYRGLTERVYRGTIGI